MNVSAFKEKYLPAIERELTVFLSRAKDDLAPICVEMSAYQLAAGGKRIRALIPLLVFDRFGKRAEDALPIGVCAELLHNATLVHDDLQDGDEMRRGVHTVWKRWSPEQAINCGNSLFQLAALSITDSNLDPHAMGPILKLSAECSLQVIEGQADEMRLKAEAHPDLERYSEVVRGKTSAYFVFPACAALLALGIRDSEIMKAASAIGDIGEAFQIQDDLIDIWGEKGRGIRGSDIAEGKPSFPAIHALSHANETDRRTLLSILSKPRNETSEHDIQAVISIYESTRAEDAGKKKISELLESAAGTRFKQAAIDAVIKDLRELIVQIKPA